MALGALSPLLGNNGVSSLEGWPFICEVGQVTDSELRLGLRTRVEYIGFGDEIHKHQDKVRMTHETRISRVMRQYRRTSKLVVE